MEREAHAEWRVKVYLPRTVEVMRMAVAYNYVHGGPEDGVPGESAMRCRVCWKVKGVPHGRAHDGSGQCWVGEMEEELA